MSTQPWKTGHGIWASRRPVRDDRLPCTDRRRTADRRRPAACTNELTQRSARLRMTLHNRAIVAKAGPPRKSAMKLDGQVAEPLHHGQRIGQLLSEQRSCEMRPLPCSDGRGVTGSSATRIEPPNPSGQRAQSLPSVTLTQNISA